MERVHKSSCEESSFGRWGSFGRTKQQHTEINMKKHLNSFRITKTENRVLEEKRSREWKDYIKVVCEENNFGWRRDWFGRTNQRHTEIRILSTS